MRLLFISFFIVWTIAAYKTPKQQRDAARLAYGIAAKKLGDRSNQTTALLTISGLFFQGQAIRNFKINSIVELPAYREKIQNWYESVCRALIVHGLIHECAAFHFKSGTTVLKKSVYFGNTGHEDETRARLTMDEYLEALVPIIIRIGPVLYPEGIKTPENLGDEDVAKWMLGLAAAQQHTFKPEQQTTQS